MLPSEKLLSEKTVERGNVEIANWIAEENKTKSGQARIQAVARDDMWYQIAIAISQPAVKGGRRGEMRSAIDISQKSIGALIFFVDSRKNQQSLISSRWHMRVIVTH